MTFDAFRRLVLRRIAEKRLRFSLTLAGISIGISLFLAIQILNHSTLMSFRRSLESVSGQAALTVYSAASSFSESVLETVEAEHGVKYAIPLVEARAFYEGKAADGRTDFQSFTLLCVDLLKEGGLRSYKSEGRDLIEDPLVFLNQTDSLMIPRAFASRLGLRMEDSFELFGVDGRKKFTLRGLLDDEGAAKAYGGGIGVMDIDGCRYTFGKVGLLDKIDIVPREGAEVAALESSLRAKLEPLGLKVGRANDQAEAFSVMISAFQNILSFVGWLAVLVSFFIVTDTVQVSIAERTKEIATLRALGASRRQTLALLLFESFALGVIGSTAGLALGLGLAQQLLENISQSLSSQFVRDIKIDAISLTPWHVGLAFAIGLTSCLVATLLPAWRAARRDIVQDLRGRSDEDSGASPRRPWLKPLGGLAAAAAVAILAESGLAERSPVLYGIEAVFGILALLWLAPFFVEALLAGTCAILGRRNPGRARFVAGLAGDNLLRNSERTRSNVLGLIVSLGLVIVISTLNASAESSIMGWFRKTLHADLVISSYGNLLSNRSQLFSETIKTEIDALPGLKAEDGVRSYGLRWIYIQHVSPQGASLDIALKAFDPPPLSRMSEVFDFLEAPHPEEVRRALFAEGSAYAEAFERDPGSAASRELPALASSAFLKRFGTAIGEVVELRTPRGPIRLRIIASVVDYASPNGVLYIARTAYRVVWQDTLLAALFVNLEERGEIPAFKAQFDRAFFDRGLQALANEALMEQASGNVRDAFAFTRAIELSAILVALFGLMNTLIVSVLGRVREFGMLRAIGSTRGQLRGIVFLEALLLSGLGALSALAFGYFLTRFWVLKSLPSLLGWPLRFEFPFEATLKVLGLGLVVGFVAATAPAALVAKRSPTDLMREDAG